MAGKSMGVGCHWRYLHPNGSHLKLFWNTRGKAMARIRRISSAMLSGEGECKLPSPHGSSGKSIALHLLSSLCC
jgi:hypothetical protein